MDEPVAGMNAEGTENITRFILDIKEKHNITIVLITSQLLDLKRNKLEYCIFQGYVVPPIPEVIRGAKDFGLDITFMGTFWVMSKMLLGKWGPDAEGYMGVPPYSYWYMDDVQ